jgi:hypothetical protein
MLTGNWTTHGKHDPTEGSKAKEGVKFMTKLAIALLIVALGIAIANTAMAQELSVGAFGGVNSATVKFSEETEFDLSRNVGVNAGGVLTLAFGDRFGVELRGMYTQKGVDVSATGMDGSYNVNYVEIPLLATVNLPIRGASRTAVRFFAGPTVAFELSCRLLAEAGRDPVDIECSDESVNALIESPDYGLLFGVGLGFGAGPGSVTLDVAYDLGLRNLNADDPEVESFKSSTVMVSAGYVVPVARLW